MSGTIVSFNPMAMAVGASRERILELEERMRRLPEEVKINPDPEHFFAGGVYGRKLILPKGMFVVSKIHRRATLNIIVRGQVAVLTEDGIVEYIGPTVFVSKPMTKRVVYAYEETFWVTAHATEKTDLAEVEAEVIAPSFDEEGA